MVDKGNTDDLIDQEAILQVLHQKYKVACTGKASKISMQEKIQAEPTQQDFQPASQDEQLQVTGPKRLQQSSHISAFPSI